MSSNFLKTGLTAGLAMAWLALAINPAPAQTPASAAPVAMPRRSVPLRPNPSLAAPPPEVKAVLDAFFTTLKTGDTVKAYEGLLSDSRIYERKEQVQSTVSKTDQGLGLYGKVGSYEMYDNKTVGSNLMVLTYFSYSPVQPLMWRFIYYRPDKKWTLIDLGFSDDIQSWIEN